MIIRYQESFEKEEKERLFKRLFRKMGLYKKRFCGLINR
jgi:hypothetical protein